MYSMGLCSQHNQPFPELFIIANKLGIFLGPFSPLSLVTLLLSIYLNFPIRDTPPRGIILDVILWFLLILRSLMFLRSVHPCYSTYQTSIPFQDWVTLHCMYHVMCPRTCGWTWGCFCMLAVVNNAALNTGVQVCICSCFQFFQGYTSKWDCWIVL